MIVDPATLGPRIPRDHPLRLAHRRMIGLFARVLCRVLSDMGRHRMIYLPVFAIWCLAFIRVFLDPTPHLPLLFNWTPSVPYHVTLVRYGDRTLKRGDFVVYAFDGEAQRIYPGLRAQPFFKQIAGLPGDRISVVGRQVFVNGKDVGFAKACTFDRRPLAPIIATVIPSGYYYVQGTHPDSFDSRYRASGLVRADQVIGKVTPLF